MKALKEKLAIAIIIVLCCGVVVGVGYVKYKIWRAEHPNAQTWTFFVSRSR